MRNGLSRWKAAGWISVLMLCLGGLSCGSDKTTSAAPVDTSPEVSADTPLTPAEERAVTGDYQLQADAHINEENAKDEADKLEKEIESDM